MPPLTTLLPIVLDNGVEEPGQVTAAGVLGTHIGMAGETAQEEFGLRGLKIFVTPGPEALQAEAVALQAAGSRGQAAGGLGQGGGG